jgi:hypothetical protein
VGLSEVQSARIGTGDYLRWAPAIMLVVQMADDGRLQIRGCVVSRTMLTTVIVVVVLIVVVIVLLQFLR